MKSIKFCLAFLLFHCSLKAQKTEYSIGLHTGLFSFTGTSAASVSFINYSDLQKNGYTNDPYGTRSSLGYGISASIKRSTRKSFLFGLSLGFEKLKARIAINQVNGYDGISSYQYPAIGNSFLQFHFINFKPFAGYRIILNKIAMDIITGIDVAPCISAKEKATATASNGMYYSVANNRKTINTDFRPGLQTVFHYQNFSILLDYSFGQVNYKSGYIGGVNEVYSRVFRLGIYFQPWKN
jgi:hypothetical protein